MVLPATTSSSSSSSEQVETHINSGGGYVPLKTRLIKDDAEEVRRTTLYPSGLGDHHAMPTKKGGDDDDDYNDEMEATTQALENMRILTNTTARTLPPDRRGTPICRGLNAAHNRYKRIRRMFLFLDIVAVAENSFTLKQLLRKSCLDHDHCQKFVPVMHHSPPLRPRFHKRPCTSDLVVRDVAGMNSNNNDSLVKLFEALNLSSSAEHKIRQEIALRDKESREERLRRLGKKLRHSSRREGTRSTSTGSQDRGGGQRTVQCMTRALFKDVDVEGDTDMFGQRLEKKNILSYADDSDPFGLELFLRQVRQTNLATEKS